MANQLLKTISLPDSGEKLPFLTVGVMMFGKRADEKESRRIVDAALERGLNFFDTADAYQNGDSERILGRALKGRRDRCIVATKVGYGKTPQGNEEGLSRATILRAIDDSLGRLAMDHVDIFYLHRPDPVIPIEESLGAMAEVIRAGKARHFGISNYGAWQSLEILHLCDQNGWPRPVISQMVCNPLMRGIEIEYCSFARKYGVLLTVYNPLAGGLLTGKYAGPDDRDKGGRFVNNPIYERRYWSERMFQGMRGLKAIADSEGMSLTRLALNWLAQRGKVDNILLGPSNLEQMLDCIAAGERPISDAGMKKIDDFLVEFEGTDATYAR